MTRCQKETGSPQIITETRSLHALRSRRRRHHRSYRDPRGNDDVPDDGLHHLRAAGRARGCGDGCGRRADGDLSGVGPCDAHHGLRGQLSHRCRAGDGPQLLLRVHRRRCARHAVAGRARGRGHRRPHLHPHGGRRTARAGHHGASRVAEARDHGRDRSAHHAHRPRVGRRGRRFAGDARDARPSRIAAGAAHAGHARGDGGAAGARGPGRRRSSA